MFKEYPMCDIVLKSDTYDVTASHPTKIYSNQEERTILITEKEFESIRIFMFKRTIEDKNVRGEQLFQSFIEKMKKFTEEFLIK